MKRLFVLSAAVLVAAACSSDSRAPTGAGSAPAAGAFTLSGVVTASQEDGGQAIGQALVEASNGAGSRSVMTEASGSYSLRGLSSGRWSVVANRAGYDPEYLSVDLTRDTTLDFALTREVLEPRARPAVP